MGLLFVLFGRGRGRLPPALILYLVHPLFFSVRVLGYAFSLLGLGDWRLARRMLFPRIGRSPC